MSTQTIIRTVGSTSQSIDLSLVQNAASTAAGDPVLGIAFNTSGLQSYYQINATGAVTLVTLVTQTVTGAYSSGGFVLRSNTTAPGQYRFDIPNAVLASAGYACVTFSGTPAGTAGNMETHTLHIMVTSIDFYSTMVANMSAVAMTESYATAGSAPTLAQAIFELLSQLQQPNWSGVTLTTKKLDGSTTAMTFTANAATGATSMFRAT